MKRSMLLLTAMLLIASFIGFGCSESSSPLTPKDVGSKTARQLDAPPDYYYLPVYLEIESGEGTVSRRLDIPSEQDVSCVLRASADHTSTIFHTVTAKIKNNSGTTVAQYSLNHNDFPWGVTSTQTESGIVTLPSGVYTVYLISDGIHPGLYDMRLSVIGYY